MEYYLISKADIVQAIDDFNNSVSVSLTEILLKDKQPVEEIANGMPYKISGDVINFCLNQNQNEKFIVYIQKAGEK